MADDKAAGDNQLVKDCNARIKVLKSKYNDLTESVGLQKTEERIMVTKSKILSKDETIQKAQTFSKDEAYQKAKTMSEIRAVTNSKLKYDKLPLVVNGNDFERLAAEQKILYRGVMDNGNISAKEISDQLKYGKLWTGNKGGAIYGNGIYFSLEKILLKSMQGKREK